MNLAAMVGLEIEELIRLPGEGGDYFHHAAERSPGLILNGPQKGPVERGHIKRRRKIIKSSGKKTA